MVSREIWFVGKWNEYHSNTEHNNNIFANIFQFQSHQIFHVLVIAAAFVHYHGISEMAMYRVTVGECDVPHPVIAL